MRIPLRGGRRWRAVRDPAPMCSVAIRRRCVWTLDEAAIRGDHSERTSALSRSVGGISRSVDPSGMPVQVVAGMHDPTALAGQDPQVLNFGHEWRRIKAMQRTEPVLPTKVQCAGHKVISGPVMSSISGATTGHVLWDIVCSVDLPRNPNHSVPLENWSLVVCPAIS